MTGTILTLVILFTSQLPMDHVLHENAPLGMAGIVETSDHVEQPVYSATDKFGNTWKSYSQDELNKILVRENAKPWIMVDDEGRRWQHEHLWKLKRDIETINRGIRKRIEQRNYEKWHVWEYGEQPVYVKPQQPMYIQPQTFGRGFSMGNFGGMRMGGGACVGGG